MIRGKITRAEFFERAAAPVKVDPIVLQTIPADKQEICNVLCLALFYSRTGSDIRQLEYIRSEDGDSDQVIAYFEGECKHIINLTGETSVGMIRDIIVNLGI